MASEIPRRLLEYLAEGLVDEPDEVSVEQFEQMRKVMRGVGRGKMPDIGALLRDPR